MKKYSTPSIAPNVSTFILSPKVRNLEGQRFGRLVVIRYDGPVSLTNNRGAAWYCRCDCGNFTRIAALGLRTERSRSCGCLARENKAINSTRHGGARTPEYNVWHNLKRRCTHSKHPGYSWYGARGITLCDRWSGARGFAHFIADVGPRPTPQHSLDRIDNERGYEPGNVRWTTSTEQSRNRRTNTYFTVDDVTLCLADWVARSGIPNSTLRFRLRKGMSMKEALAFTKVPRKEPQE